MRSDYLRRLHDIHRFYELLDSIENNCGGKRLLGDCHGKMNWPKRGIYFFFEPDEIRTTSGDGLRIVRVGTHAIDKPINQKKLWDRLISHRGTFSGKFANGGNHRTSVFRKHIGYAVIAKDHYDTQSGESWGQGNSAKELIRWKEHPIELAVSQYIRKMPFIWVPINDAPGPKSLRSYIERNAIALFSNYLHPEHKIDEPDKKWLGHWTKSEYIRKSGMWNVYHVNEIYDPKFLDCLEYLLFRVHRIKVEP
jgi:hypothetical protein